MTGFLFSIPLQFNKAGCAFSAPFQLLELMAKFLYFKRENCPVCHGQRRDCRQSHRNGIIFCRGTNTAPAGWGFIGEDRHGFSMWVPGDRQRQAPAKPAPAPTPIAESLPPEGRDRHWRRIIRHSDLSSQHQAQLLQRPYVTLAEVKPLRALVFSWQGGEHLHLPQNFPGADGYGALRRYPHSWAIAIPDINGQLIGAQIKNPDGGYLWASSSSINGAGPQLPNGELPLGIYGDRNPGGVVYLAEGFLKPALATLRYGGTWIGAAGGNWARGPEQLRAALDALRPRRVVLCPDGGAISNRHVLKQYRAVRERLASWGYSLQVQWWGQTTKLTGDVDEISSDTWLWAEQLEWEAFWAMVPAKIQRKLTRQRLVLPWPQRSIREKQRRAGGALVRLEDTAIQSLPVTPATLPSFADWQRIGQPVLLFDGDERAKIYDRLIAYGYPLVLDCGPTGDGKTTATASYLQEWARLQAPAQWELAGYGPTDTAAWGSSEHGSPPDLLENRAVYYAAHYRKPSNLALEGIPETATGGGLVLDATDPLPSGAPSRRRPRAGEPPDLAPLCVEDDNVQRLRAKGIDAPRGSDSALCENCPHFEDCPYLAALAEQKQFPALRSHLSKGGTGTVAFVDEASRSITTEREITVTQKDLAAELGRLILDSTTRGEIAELAGVVVQSLNYAIAERGLYGMAHHELAQFLPTPWELKEEIASIEAGLCEQAMAGGGDPWDMPITAVDRELARVANHDLNNLLGGITSTDAKARLIDEVLQAGAICQVLATLTMGAGAIEITPQGQLKLQRRCDCHRKTLRRFDTVILLDATPDLPTLAQQLQVPQRDITRICPLPRHDYSNLHITIVDGVGTCGRQRYGGGEWSLRSRLQLLAGHLVSTSADPSRTGLIDTKYYVLEYEALNTTFGTVLGYNWRDQQNTNKFKRCTTLIAINPKPYMAMTAAATTWKTRHGTSRLTQAQQAWLERQAQSHLLQVIGRLRAQWTNEPKNLYLVGHNLTAWDVMAISAYYPGCIIERRNVADICPASAPRDVQARRQLLATLTARIELDQATTQREIAAELGCTPGNVAQKEMVKAAGGWKCLVALLQSLYRVAKRPDHRPPELADQLRWVEEWLPEILDQWELGDLATEAAVEAVVDTLDMLGNWGLWLCDDLLARIWVLLLAAAPAWSWRSLLPNPPPSQANIAPEIARQVISTACLHLHKYVF